jgi:hypothetical protein
MFNEAGQLMITRTELDDVFFQQFAYDATNPGIATAQTAAIFKPMNTTHSAYIGAVNKGSGLFTAIGESSTVPLSTPRVSNKYTYFIQDWANSIQISKDLFDDNLHKILNFVKYLSSGISCPCAAV